MAHEEEDYSSWSVAELVEGARREADDVFPGCLTQLRRRGTRDVFNAARDLLNGDAEEQELGCAILSELGWPERRKGSGKWPFRDESVPLLLSATESPHSPVVEMAIIALGRLEADEVVRAAAKLASHPEEGVRQAVAMALLTREDDASIDVLVCLSTDAESDVRDWATFGLGVQCHRNDASVLDALADRLEDPHDQTRLEAIEGLAKKGDARAIPSILRELKSDGLYEGTLDAAIALPNRAFVEPLRNWLKKFKSDPDDLRWRQLVKEALAACEAGGNHKH